MKSVEKPLKRAYEYILEENKENETQNKNLALVTINEALHEIEKLKEELQRLRLEEAIRMEPTSP